MEIDSAHYHGWQGRLLSPWVACWGIVRVALMQVMRTKSYWLVLALGGFRFAAYASIIYAVTQLSLPPDAQRVLLQRFGFSAEAELDQDNGYIGFMNGQNVIVMILLAFSGSQLVGSDFRTGALPFYLSRRIDRRHYVVGKLLAVSAVIALLTVVPALFLFVEYGLLSSSARYWIDNWRVAVAVLAFGTSIAVVNSILLVTISAYLERIVPIAITWASLFLLLGRLGDYLYRETDNAYWRLMDLWRDTRLIGQLCFDQFATESDRQLSRWAVLVLGLICALSLVALVRRVRAVEIVE